jgi:hypothetical protein
MVLLDSDKVGDAEKLCQALPRLRLCKNMDEFKACCRERSTCPVYCHRMKDISLYFKGDTKKGAVQRAMEQDEVPEEFERLFLAFLGSAGLLATGD